MTSAFELSNRGEFCSQRLGELTACLQQSPVLARFPGLSVSAVGSYGRREAGPNSDLDLIVVTTGVEPQPGPAERDQVKYELMRVVRDLRFPPLDRNGQFLKVHCLPTMLSHLGGPLDDIHNSLTARLLLLLESVPVLNPGIHQEVVSRIINTYYSQYNQHRDGFRPLTLVNDITLYYLLLWMRQEQRQNRMVAKRVLAANQAKIRLKRVKLRFSRRVTCHSMITCLLADPAPSPDVVLRLAGMSPMDRWRDLADRKHEIATFRALEREYRWFLMETSQPDIRQRLLDNEYYRRLKENGDGFRRTIVNLATEVLPPEHLGHFFI